MKHKVAELKGALLDAAVAKAEGLMPAHGWDSPSSPDRTVRPSPGQFAACSTDWSDGGPIIERERIELSISERGEGWWANLYGAISLVGVGAWGPTPLIAAMRAYVASKFGEEVELP